MACGKEPVRDHVRRPLSNDVRKHVRAQNFVQSPLAKLYASEAAWRIADRALQIHGGYGYTRDFPLERYLRDLRIFRVYEGSSEIQRTIIARDLLR